jgi:hypothetical protein
MREPYLREIISNASDIQVKCSATQAWRWFFGVKGNTFLTLNCFRIFSKYDYFESFRIFSESVLSTISGT